MGSRKRERFFGNVSRLEKERQAVLSEMTMVNTIEYCVECQILSTLHREKRIGQTISHWQRSTHTELESKGCQNVISERTFF